MAGIGVVESSILRMLKRPSFAQVGAIIGVFLLIVQHGATLPWVYYDGLCSRALVSVYENPGRAKTVFFFFLSALEITKPNANELRTKINFIVSVNADILERPWGVHYSRTVTGRIFQPPRTCSRFQAVLTVSGSSVG